MQLTPYLYYNELVHTNITGKYGGIFRTRDF